MPDHVDSFIATYGGYAFDIAEAYGIPADVILAQGAIESGYGRDIVGNNMFGVKGVGPAGSNTVATHEDFGRGLVPTTGTFRAYNSVAQSMADYARLLTTNPSWSPIMANQNLTSRQKLDQLGPGNLGNAAYYTDRSYPSGAVNTIRQSPEFQRLESSRRNDPTSFLESHAGLGGYAPPSIGGFSPLGKEDWDPYADWSSPDEAARAQAASQMHQPQPYMGRTGFPGDLGEYAVKDYGDVTNRSAPSPIFDHSDITDQLYPEGLEEIKGSEGQSFLYGSGSPPDPGIDRLGGPVNPRDMQVGVPYGGLEVTPAFPNTDYDAVAGFSPGSSVFGKGYDPTFDEAGHYGSGVYDAGEAVYNRDPTQFYEDRQNEAIEQGMAGLPGFSPDPYGGYAASSSTGYAGGADQPLDYSAPGGPGMPAWSDPAYGGLADPYGGRAATSSTGYSAPPQSVFDQAGYNQAQADYDRALSAYNASVSQARDFPATANPNSGLQPAGNTLGTSGVTFGVPGSSGAYWGLDEFGEDPYGFGDAMKGGFPSGVSFATPQAAPAASRAPAPGPRPTAPQRAAFTSTVPTKGQQYATALSPANYGAGGYGGSLADASSGAAPGVSYEGSISGRSTNDAFGNNYDTFTGPNWSDSGQMYASNTGGNTDMTGFGGKGAGSAGGAGGAGGAVGADPLGAYGNILDQIIAQAAAEAFAGGYGGYADPYGGGGAYGGAYNDSSGYNYR